VKTGITCSRPGAHPKWRGLPGHSPPHWNVNVTDFAITMVLKVLCEPNQPLAVLRNCSCFKEAV